MSYHKYVIGHYFVKFHKLQAEFQNIGFVTGWLHKFSFTGKNNQDDPMRTKRGAVL